jgi:hypothetical protein
MKAKRRLWWDSILPSSWFVHVKRRNEQAIAPDNQQVAALQAYLDCNLRVRIRAEARGLSPRFGKMAC